MLSPASQALLRGGRRVRKRLRTSAQEAREADQLNANGTVSKRSPGKESLIFPETVADQLLPSGHAPQAEFRFLHTEKGHWRMKGIPVRRTTRCQTNL
ncbi:hypothetical protein ACOMHN_017900 [Nucella lapillus]